MFRERPEYECTTCGGARRGPGDGCICQRIFKNFQDAEWMDEGACLSEDPETFFPEPGAAARPVVAKAYSLCLNCPVALECANYAINNHEMYGVWGATTPKQRVQLRKKKEGRERNQAIAQLHHRKRHRPQPGYAKDAEPR